jgi:hypothetical protein
MVGTGMRKAVTLTLDEDVLEKAKQKALEDNRTLSNYTEYLLIKELRSEASKETKARHTEKVCAERKATDQSQK